MNPRTLNSFIVIFLIIAIIAGSSIFAFSHWSQNTTAVSETAAPDPRTAFVESVGGKALVPVNNAAAQNLTDGLSQVVANQVMQANPDGPLDDGNSLKVQIPTATSSLNAYLDT